MPNNFLASWVARSSYLVVIGVWPLWLGCSSLSRGPTADHVVLARQLSLQATDAMQKGRWEDAESLFSQALAACPADERAHTLYAETLWRRGASEEAIEHLEAAVKLSGGAPDLRVQLGNMYLARNDLAAAMSQANAALQADRKQAGAWALRGDVLHHQAQAQEALACYHRSLTHQAHFPHVQLAVAQIYQRQKRYQRVLATLQNLEDGFPPGQVPQHVLMLQGIALKSMGRYDDAVDRLSATASEHASAELLYHLGEAQLLAGNPSSARVAILEALERSPQHAPSLRLKGELEMRQPKVANAGPAPHPG